MPKICIPSNDIVAYHWSGRRILQNFASPQFFKARRLFEAFASRKQCYKTWKFSVLHCSAWNLSYKSLDRVEISHRTFIHGTNGCLSTHPHVHWQITKVNSNKDEMLNEKYSREHQPPLLVEEPKCCHSLCKILQLWVRVCWVFSKARHLSLHLDCNYD